MLKQEASVQFENQFYMPIYGELRFFQETLFMCGIAGILSPLFLDNQKIVTKMAQTLYHRGPDMGDSWQDTQAGIALGHRRLSILDLSEHGAQPMVSAGGRYILTYNGEIYNYLDLRRELEINNNYVWKGHSDTEVLLAALETWGIKKTLTKANGMFAFGLWDRKTRSLTLARDRLGEKPLYLGWIDNKIVFASELKAFHCLKKWNKKIENSSVGYLLRFGFIPAPLSIYRFIYKLPAAHFISLTAKDIKTILSPDEFQKRCNCYWNLTAIADHGVNNQFPANEEAILDPLDQLLNDSIKKRMLADVSVGALLSGGIDSSLVTAIMQQNCSHPIQTFTIGFEEDKFDEAPFSRRVAKHIGCNHTEVTLSAKDALNIIPSLSGIYSEPFADPSQIPTSLVSSIARQHVIVALSGDGGDELFGGYARYRTGVNFWSVLRLIPPKLRQAAGLLLSKAMHGNYISSRGSHKMIPFRLWRLGQRISAASFDSFYGNLLALSLCQTTINDWPAELPVLDKNFTVPDSLETEQHMMFIDQASYLPDNILVKSDRASMAPSLELRIPLLDHRIVEFSWRIPRRLKRQGNEGKPLLRHLLYRYVPQYLVDRPKKGFDIPLDSWLRGPLREWMLDLLSADAMKENEYLDSIKISNIIKDHLSGQSDYGYTLWPILMFQEWLNQQK